MSNGVLFCVRVRESGVTVRVCKSESSCSCGMGSRGGRCGERTGLEGDERALGCFREWRRNTRCHFGRKSEAFLACWRWSWYGCDLRLSSSSSSREWQSANHVEHAINVSIKKKNVSILCTVAGTACKSRCLSRAARASAYQISIILRKMFCSPSPLLFHSKRPTSPPLSHVLHF